MATTASLGSLARLSPELRFCVYQQIALTLLENCPHKAALLQTSRRLSQEFSHYLDAFWRRTELNFEISPSGTHGPWLSLTSNTGFNIVLSHMSDAMSRGFASLPYDRIKAINLKTRAPERTDPGQAILTWQRCQEFVSLLLNRRSASGDLPNMNISLTQNIVTGSWFNLDQACPQQSLPIQQPNCPILVYEEDYCLVLSPFLRLRHVREATITVPRALTNYLQLHGSNFLPRLESFMMECLPFGEVDARCAAPSDRGIEYSLSDLYLRMERKLDTIPGPTASQLRLERFAIWFDNGLGSRSEHQEAIISICSNLPQRSDEERSAIDMHIHFLEERYKSMRALNPGSLYQQYGHCSQWYAKLYTPAENQQPWSVLDAVGVGLLRDSWCPPQIWFERYGASGIGPLNSQEVSEWVTTACSGDPCRSWRYIGELWNGPWQ